jgi:spore coat protein U-like protein
VEINSAWETIRENIKISAKESIVIMNWGSISHGSTKNAENDLDQRKQAKLQWLQDPSEINADNLNNVRREASRYFMNKKREYLKDKINEFATNSKNKNITDLCRGIN